MSRTDRSPAQGAAAFAIDRDGTWYHDGRPIRREAMVRLFAGMLRRDARGYFLEAPDQRIRVDVRDAPFVVVECERFVVNGEPEVMMTLATGESFTAGPEHALELGEDAGRGERRVYLLARDGMPALVHRNVFYRLAEFAEYDAASGRHGIRSRGCFFPLE